jgi:hypothetical protein
MFETTNQMLCFVHVLVNIPFGFVQQSCLNPLSIAISMKFGYPKALWIEVII